MCKNPENDPKVDEILEKIKHCQLLKSAARGHDRILYTQKLSELKFELQQAKTRVAKVHSQLDTPSRIPAFGPSRFGPRT